MNLHYDSTSSVSFSFSERWIICFPAAALKRRSEKHEHEIKQERNNTTQQRNSAE